MKTNFQKLLFMAFALLTSKGYAQCDDHQVRLDSIKNKYESKYQNIEREGKDIANKAPDPGAMEAVLGSEIEIKMQEQHFSLDLVSVTMKNQKITMDLPQITMEPKSIKFDQVYTKNVLKKTGQYPEVHCKNVMRRIGFVTTKVPSCKTVWKDILTHVPEIHTKTIEIKTNLPLLKMSKTEFTTAIPQFKLTRQDIKMHIPSVKITNIKAEVKKIEEDALGLQEESESLASQQKSEFASAINETFNCQREVLLSKRSEIIESFSNSMKEIDSNIRQLQESGIDPSNIKTDDGKTFNLLNVKNEIAVAERNALAQIDSALEDFNKKEKETIAEHFKEVV